MAHRLLSMRTDMKRRARLQAGFSLTEMLVVLAIIGIMTLISVPNFMAYYRSSKLKNSMRQLATDLRSARQRAVSQNEMTKIAINLNVNPGTYTIYESKDGKAVTDSTKTWTAIGNQQRLNPPCYFSDSNIKSGALAEFVFINDGTAQVSSNPATAIMKSSEPSTPSSFTISVYTTGKVSAN